MKITSWIFLSLFTAFILLLYKVTIPERAMADSGASQSSQSQYPPRIDSFEAFPAMFNEGDSIELAWETSHTTEVHISGVGMVNLSGNHRIASVHFDHLDDILLTASNDGDFAPVTKKLNMQIVLLQETGPLPNGFLSVNRDKPLMIIGDRATLSKNIRKYKLQPVNKKAATGYSQNKPLSPKTSTSSAVKKSKYIKPMTAKPMNHSMAQLNAPQIISPKNNSMFSHYPRTLKLRWRPVSNASVYNVEIDCMHCCAAKEWCTDVGRKYKKVNAIRDTFFKFNFVGSQPGRWRVQAVEKNCKTGKYSQWYYFKFTK